jgi:acetyl esterase
VLRQRAAGAVANFDAQRTADFDLYVMLCQVPDSLTNQLADPELAAYVESLREIGPTARQLGATALRAAQRKRVSASLRGPELAVVEDMTTSGGVRVRLYRPTVEPLPLVVFLHGGMWTIGDLDSHDRACRRLALSAQAAVVAVDFRRAPEHCSSVNPGEGQLNRRGWQGW